MLSKTSNITVQLLEPTIFIESESDACNVIRGTINLNMPKTTTVNALSVRFDGKMETKFSSFDLLESSHNKKKPLVRQRLILYPTMDQPSHRPLVLNTGLTQFGFEMQVPSGLPETVECCDINVNYHVTAVMEYYTNTNGFIKNNRRLVKEVAKQDVRVARLPKAHLIASDNINRTIDSHTHQGSWLNYQILVDRKAVAIGSDLPVTFRLSNVKKGVLVDRVSVKVLERREVYLDNSHVNHTVHTIQPAKHSKCRVPKSPLDKTWEGTIDYQVPEGKSIVHSTQNYSDFNVSHMLIVSLLLSLPSGKNCRTQKMITFQTSIDVLDESLNEGEVLELPSYDAPPPFDNTEYVFGEYDRKFAEPPAYEDLFV